MSYALVFFFFFINFFIQEYHLKKNQKYKKQHSNGNGITHATENGNHKAKAN